MQDISADHAHKTVTLEFHPHLKDQIRHVAIHPCKHAQTMKRLCEQMSQNDIKDANMNSNQVSVDQYFFIFLKFIASVIPTIEYDYTMR